MSLRWTEDDYRRFQERAPQPPTLDEIGKRHGLEPKRTKANKTEEEYATRLKFEFPHCKPEFEALSFHLLNGHKYTPDWVVKLPDGQILCVEVKARGKNGFRQASYGRAKLAFDQARIEWPVFMWRWAEKYCGQWLVKDYEGGQLD